jgi:hypothetical protein
MAAKCLSHFAAQIGDEGADRSSKVQVFPYLSAGNRS